MPPNPPPGYTLDDTPAPPRGYTLDEREPRRSTTPPRSRPRTGTIDGDTVRIGDETVRVFGMDAPERNQWGYDREGRVPIGEWSGLQTATRLGPDARRGAPQGVNFGRTVAPVTIGDEDLARGLLREGWGYAAPEFITNDPERRFDYLQAERLARQNRLGVHDYYVTPPEQFRQNPGYIPARETVAQFFDTPTPIAGMSPAIEQRYVELLNTATDPAEVVAFVESQAGFKVDPAAVAAVLRARDAAREQNPDFRITGDVTYERGLRPLTDIGDGQFGAGARGYSQGFVAGGLDELGAVADMFGGTEGRENIWNSDRRWADIWYNNQQQNSSILGFDAFKYPGTVQSTELAGAVTSGFVIPYGSGARTVPQLARVGAEYGAATALLSNEGSVTERLTTPSLFGLPSMIVDPAIGAVGNVALGKAAEAIVPNLPRAWRETNAPEPSPAARAAGYVDDAVPAPREAPPLADEPPAPPEGFVVDEPTVEAPEPAVGPETPAEAVPEGVDAPSEEAAPPPRRGGPRGPDDMIRFIGRNGGISFDGLGPKAREAGHRGDDLRNTGSLNKFTPGVGRIIRQNGRGVDEMGEMLWDAGYFGPPETTPRPTEAEVLAAVEHSLSSGERRFSFYDEAPEQRAPAVDYEEPEAVRQSAEWARYDRISDAAASRYRTILLRQDTDEIEALMRSGTETRDPVEPNAELTDDELAPWIGDWLNRKIDEVLDDAHLEADDAFYDARTFETGPLGRGAEGPPAESGNAPEGAADDGTRGAARAGDDSEPLGRDIPPLTDGTNSWVAVDRTTGRSVFETFNESTARKINQDKYEVLTNKQWLERYNAAVKASGGVEPDTAALIRARDRSEPLGSIDDWQRARDERIAASKAAGNTHLDQVDAYVETMRGREFYNVHDPNERGTVRTVSNDGDVVVHWADDYSAQKNLAEAKTYGKKTVYETWLMPSDLQDYVFVSRPGQAYRPEGPRTVAEAFDLPALQERLERAVGKNVTMRIVDSLGGPAGMFTNVRGPTKVYGRLIEVARDTAPGDGTYTLDHEITHALRDLGAFTKADWNIVAARARKETALMQSIAERYSHLDGEAQLEEAVADLFAKWQRGDYKPTSRVAAAFERIRQVFEAIRNAWRGDGLRTARGVMEDMGEGRLAGRRGERAAPGSDAAKEMVVYHGSPHDFDEFSMDKIGTGEGAQAYGHGLYFTSTKEIAEHYRTQLSRDRGRYLWDGDELYSDRVNDRLMEAAQRAGGEGVGEFTVIKIADDIMTAAENGDSMKDMLRFVRQSDWDADTKAAWAAALRLADENMRFEPHKGRLYEVDIPEDGEYLLWDAPLSEQPEEVQRALAQAGIEVPPLPAPPADPTIRSILREALRHARKDRADLELTINNDSMLYNKGLLHAERAGVDTSDIDVGEYVTGLAREYVDALEARELMTGEQAYKNLAARLVDTSNDLPEGNGWQVASPTVRRDERAASQALREAGIPGIKYFDGMSRSAGEGSHNYVLFDDQSARIVSKASIPESDDYRPGIQWRIGDDPIAGAIPETRTLTEAMGSEPSWRGRAGQAFDRFRTAMQDRHLPLLRTQQAIERMTGRPLPDELNPYMGEELMSGRIGAQLDKLNDDMVRPLFDDMAERRVTVSELETFLRARHAPERNARMAEINPKFAEGGGSGMTDAEAATILEEFRAAGKTDNLTALAARVDAIRDYSLNYRQEAGLISPEDVTQWRTQYPNYVPLRGFKGEEGAARPNQSGGINVRGRESQRAFGRESESDSPLAYTLLQAEEAITRAETNRVAQRLIGLAEANPDDDFWKVNKVSTRQRINEETGLVEDYSTNQLLAEDKDWTISAKRDGKEVRLTLNRDNPAARQMATSLRRLTEHQLDLFSQHAGKLNRFLSTVNTTLNPEFIISNAFRDLQTATINLAGVDVKGLETGTLADYPAALVAATKGSFRKGGGDWRRWYDDFIEDGGRVYFNRIEDVAQIRRRIQKSFRLAASRVEGGKATDHIQRGFMAVKDLVENLNSGVENAVRLAAYKNARQRGMSRDQAASLAKNLTVNFNRRGTFGPAMNALYLFYNASVQGTARMLMATKSPKVRKMLAAIASAGAASEMLNSMTSAVDEDGESFYDKIPAYEKSTNLIFMLPGGKNYIKIPAPWGYNAVWEAGRTPVEIWRRGGRGWQESAGNYLTTLVDSFNPVGGTETLLNFVSPTIADPFIDIYQNRNFAGSPIMPIENPFEPPVPDHRRFFDSVAPQWQAISGFLNEASGGNEVESGMVSVSPETLEHLFDFTIGGAGRFAERTFDLAAKGARGEDVDIGDIPFVRRVVGEKPEWLDKSTFYDRLQEVELQMEYRDEFVDRGLEDEANEFMEREAAALSLEQDAKDARRELRAIRKERRGLEGDLEAGTIDRAAFKEGMAAIDEREAALVLSFNTRWNEAVRGAGPMPPADTNGGEINVRRSEEPPPPPGYEVDVPEGEAAGLNIYQDLQDEIPGVRFSSGFRDYDYNQSLQDRGYNAADNSTHMDGDTLDMLPPQGKSLSWLRTKVAALYPDAELLVHDGHLHARFPGYYGAPVLGGAVAAGVRNPHAGMPAPPAGYTVD